MTGTTFTSTDRGAVATLGDSGGNLTSVAGDMVFITGTSQLAVDIDGNGTISGTDYRITLTGNTVVPTGAGVTFNITGSANADTITTGAGADTITALGGADIITGGAGADSIVLGGGTDADVLHFGTGDTALTIGGTGNAGTISGFDVVTGFVTGTTANQKDLLNFTGTGAIGAIGTWALNGTDSTLTIGGAAVGSHAITAGKIVFHTGDAAGAAITVDSDAKLAAVVQYLITNDIGAAGDTLAFVYGADSYVYSQAAATNGITGGFALIKVVGVAVAALETVASTTDLNIFIA
jgi:hypothetical protein